MKSLLIWGLAVLALSGGGSAARADDLVAAVLPASRSGVVGQPVTVFATVINSSGSDASGCIVSTDLPGVTVSFQTTDPATNRPNGSPNVPVAIGNGHSQSFLLVLVSSEPLSAADVPLTFACTGLRPAKIISGLDTLLLTTDSSMPPDIVALAITVKDNGVVDVDSDNGSAAFAVATIDVGAGATITATPELGDLSNLPVTLTICQTVPATGACMAAPSASVTTTYVTGGVATFGVFVTASGPVPFDPASSRVFVVFTDSSNIIRGKTSVALDAEPKSHHPGDTPGGFYVGLWRVTSSAVPPQPITAMVSEDGEFHLLPGKPSPIMRETLQLTADQNLILTGAGNAYAAGVGPTAETGAVTVTGTFSPRRALVLAYQNGSETGLFRLNYVPGQYERSSSLALLPGTWTQRDESEAAIGTLTIAADGTFSGMTTAGCSETGNFSVINANFGVYRVAVDRAACGSVPAATFRGLSLIGGGKGVNDTLATEISDPDTAIAYDLTKN